MQGVAMQPVVLTLHRGACAVGHVLGLGLGWIWARLSSVRQQLFHFTLYLRIPLMFST